MDVGLAVGRILLVAIFIFSGAVKFIDVSGTAAHIADKGLPMPTVLAVAAGAVEVVCGLMVAVGWCTRLAALVLLVFTGAAAFLFHDFWNLPSGREQIGQMGFIAALSGFRSCEATRRAGIPVIWRWRPAGVRDSVHSPCARGRACPGHPRL